VLKNVSVKKIIPRYNLAQSPEFIGDILGRTHIGEADALQTYTSLHVDDINNMLGN